MKWWIKRLLVLGVLASLYPLAEFCKKQTDGFTIADISPFDGPKKEYATPPMQEHVKAHLTGRFRYLKCGGQSYAFVSEDGQTVLKLFKHNTRRAPIWALNLPLPRPLHEKCQKKCERHFAKMQRDFDSYQLAFEELKEESGLIYVHLGQTDHLHQEIVITDKLGIEHRLNADNLEFILQKKGELLYPYLRKIMDSGNIQGARLAVHALLDLIVTRCKKGIHDEDASIHRNLGFDGDRPVFIDVGKFVKDPARQDSTIYREDLQLMTRRFNEWLKQEHPRLVPVLERELETISAQN